MAGKCPDCGGPMKPLAWSEYCPNDCDRKDRGKNPPTLELEEDYFLPKRGDFLDEEITLDLGPPSSINPATYNSDDDDVGGWAGLDSLLDGVLGADLRVTCPDCGSSNTEEFLNCNSGDWHCNPCGHVWYK